MFDSKRSLQESSAPPKKKEKKRSHDLQVMDRAPLGLKSQICESHQFHGLGDSYVKNMEHAISDDDTFFTEEN